MREHIYKAKRIYNGEWVEGYYLYFSDNHFIFIEDEFDYTNDRGTLDGDAIKIDHKTLSQYTNLKDKNGNKIFENDIIEFANGARYKIIFEDYMFKISNETHREGLFESKDDSIEIIGNTFDNFDNKEFGEDRVVRTLEINITKSTSQIKNAKE